MNQEERPSPESFLEAIHQEESLLTKGQLKIFLGMAAGVGKTYAMLEEAQALAKEGVDVVVGIVDTHGRQETASLLNNLKILPEKSISYRDREFKELDVDAVIQRKPQLVLVDELAHSNIPGSKHAKRWQDVLEILDNGIDVYTTLNVQHIESLNDIVHDITDTTVRETVPDILVEKASSVQLVDLTPDELLQRLREGKIYLGDQSQIATRHFFQKDRLTALREIVLRYAADKVDRDLRVMFPVTERTIEWKPREKFLVAVSSSPHSQKLIRTTRRLAAITDTPWIALHVDDGSTLEEKAAEQLAKNLALARDLGAEVVTVYDPQVVEGIKRVARQRNITQIILGRPPQKIWLGIFRRRALLDKLAAECKDIDIHVIRQEKYAATYKNRFFPSFWNKQFSEYFITSLSLLALTLLGWLISPILGYQVIGTMLLLGIISLNIFIKKLPIFFTSILYVFLWDFFFIPPIYSFQISSTEDIFLFFLYGITALVIGTLVNKARAHQEALAKNEASTQLLYQIVRQLAIAPSPDEVLLSIQAKLNKFFNGTYQFIIKSPEKGLRLEHHEQLLSTPNEKSTAIWAFENEKEAGFSTDTLPSALNFYLPLKGFHAVMGVLACRPSSGRILTLEEKNFLYTICQQVSIYLEHAFVAEDNKQTERLRQAEKIHKNIFDRLSRALERPIITTRNAITTLKSKMQLVEKTAKIQEINDIEDSFEIFVKILTNISAMTQLSESMIPLKKDLHRIQDVIEECCQHLEKSSKNHTIALQIDRDIPQVPFDYYLIQILLYNLVINATEHAPPGSTIVLKATTQPPYLQLSITDEGPGIPAEELDTIFERFYRLPEDTSPGIGLGLAIAKTIAELHHGHLKVENLPTKGAQFTLYIPLEEAE